MKDWAIIRIVLALVSLAMFASLAQAIPPGVPGDNVLGLYSADDGSGSAFLGDPSNQVSGPQTIYLMVTGLTDPSGIHGWECHIIVPPSIFFTGVTYSGDAINIAVAPDFAVGLAEPLLPTPDNFIVLASIDFFVSPGLTDVFLHMEPSTQPSIPGFMVYALGSDPGVLLPFAWSSGSPLNPSFSFNAGPIIYATEGASWGSVKAMYR